MCKIAGIVIEHGNNDFGYWEGFYLTEDEYNNTYNRYYAKQIADVLRKFAEKPQNIDNFENYLENCFTGWKEKFANTPEKMIEDMKHFAEMEI